MYAIVEIAGKQFKVSKGDSVSVPVLASEVGKDVHFDRVLLISDKGKISVGQPTIANAKVTAKVDGFGRDRKVTIFKKKRRKGYQKTQGHRQGFADITIKNISVSKKKTAGEKSDGA